ncbi:hypothetical protein J4H86_08850 [Spiractinospora alimapuensis]|uniref:ABC transporter permease n=1 Tax=Spiractinospora alimapuensis TaxID=2820884 RepID=UPI001F3AC4EC|nr:ABC transporter permease [Spiractinospora alimapuensis]QVQ53803.1 hypothetical protein J4H86_08850 [Spiractinospora alimapuensis]
MATQSTVRPTWPRITAALGGNDRRSVFRDPLLIMVLASPLLYIIMVRIPVPPLTDHLASGYGFDLVPYYPLIVSSFPMLGTMLLLGCAGGLMLLEEKDTGTLHALRVTPMPLAVFAAYRCATIIVVSTGYVAAAMWLSGIAPTSLLPAVLVLGPLTGLLAIVIALAMAGIANNKVEGLAMIRALGFVLFMTPVGAFIVDERWETAFWLVPSYWPSKALWVAWDGGDYWPYALVGVLYSGAVIAALGRVFVRRAG